MQLCCDLKAFALNHDPCKGSNTSIQIIMSKLIRNFILGYLECQWGCDEIFEEELKL